MKQENRNLNSGVKHELYNELLRTDFLEYENIVLSERVEFQENEIKFLWSEKELNENKCENRNSNSGVKHEIDNEPLHEDFLEYENIVLSERVEFQENEIKFLWSEKEFNKNTCENLESEIQDLQNRIKKLKIGNEILKNRSRDRIKCQENKIKEFHRQKKFEFKKLEIENQALKNRINNSLELSLINKTPSDLLNMQEIVNTFSIRISEALKRKFEDENLCCICLDNKKDNALIPCGHFVTCFDCAESVLQNDNPQCPVCRSNVHDMIHIFSA